MNYIFRSSLTRSVSKLNFFKTSLTHGSKRDFTIKSFTLQEATELSEKVPKNIQSLVDQISKLTLLENATLVKELKLKLNIKDIAMPAMMAAPAAAPAAGTTAAAAEPAVEEEKAAEKTTFSIKLEKYEAAAKSKLIREIKILIPGFTILEAKKFLESVPKVIKKDVPKEEAEKIKKLLDSLGGAVTLE
ncbi:hypothetical protein HDU92_001437 [Lobulomyces angularis]|nr:hypothetical protein HDU92_001437 [Lobulomyces angularis]